MASTLKTATVAEITKIRRRGVRILAGGVRGIVKQRRRRANKEELKHREVDSFSTAVLSLRKHIIAITIDETCENTASCLFLDPSKWKTYIVSFAKPNAPEVTE